jgi:hypothetical protein
MLLYESSLKWLSLCWSYIPDVSNLLRIFILKRRGIFSVTFFIYWSDHMVLFLILVMWYFIYIDLHMLNYPWLCKINTFSFWWIILAVGFWIQFAGIMPRSFAYKFINIFAWNILFGGRVVLDLNQYHFAMQAVYPLSHALRPFFFSCLSHRVFHFFQGSASDHGPSAYTFHILQ